MGLLDRYRKSGGFAQLLSLIESFAPAKQEKFLSLIEEENPHWSKALKEKLLTMDRIMSWPADALAEIVPQVNPKNLGIALHGFKPEQIEKLYSGLGHSERRKIEGEYELVKPSSGEIAATHFKMVDTVRQMVARGELRIEKYDPGLIIDEKFESQILQWSHYVKGDGSSEAADPAEEVTTPVIELKTESRADQSKMASELKSAQTLLLNIQKENKALKAEVKVLKDKLEQIRKIA